MKIDGCIQINAFDLQRNKKSRAVFLYFIYKFYSLILADNKDIYLLFVITYGNLLKYIAVTA